MDGICAALHEMWMSEKDSRCMLLQALSLSRLVSSSSMVHASGLTLTSFERGAAVTRCQNIIVSRRTVDPAFYDTPYLPPVTYLRYLRYRARSRDFTNNVQEQIPYCGCGFMCTASPTAECPQAARSHPSVSLGTRIKQHLPHYSCFKLVITFV